LIAENLSTLKIHKLTQAQYDKAKEAGNIDKNALYLTPDEETDVPVYSINGKTGVVTLTAAEISALPLNAEVVLYSKQALTEEQQAQARKNLGIPSTTADDNGKFLRVVDGVAAWVSIPSAEEASF
jgi:hypothetical protein